MKNIVRFSFVVLFLWGMIHPNIASAERTSSDLSLTKIQFSYQQPDSGFFSKLSKGYEIASNISLEDLGNMASLVIFSKKKDVNAIVTDVTNYLDQLSTANKQLKNIKINKNTKVIIKRDK